ncbi:hypothetical protein EHS25_007918 [Saitozyma podzolica]|jgi:hypothetical protein|uniref:Uncharacterized protein n=1 Tax=Saitozyma podzolica TaxID=1890683 RepID=A0A427YR63_9TREE|nr:hypothetical protein EHS25_007918 [Saitozyma podzolica]
MTNDFEDLSRRLRGKVNTINALDADKALRILVELTKIGHHRDLRGRTKAALRDADAFLGMGMGDYSAYSRLVSESEPAEGTSNANSNNAEQQSSASESHEGA